MIYIVTSHRHLDGVYRSKAAAQRLQREMLTYNVNWMGEPPVVRELKTWRPGHENDAALAQQAMRRAEWGHWGRI